MIMVRYIKAGGVPNYLHALDELTNAIYWVEMTGLRQCYASVGGWLRIYEWA